MKLQAKTRLQAFELDAATMKIQSIGFEPRTWEGSIVGKDGRGNSVWVVNSDSSWMVVIHDGHKLVAMLDAKDEKMARKAAKKAVDEGAKSYWSNKDPLLNYYLNSAGQVKVTLK